VWVDLDHIYTPVWPRFDLRSGSRSWTFRNCENCTFLRLSPLSFWRGAQNWGLIVIVLDWEYSVSEPDFWISFQENYYASSNFVQCRHFTKLKWPYFGTAWCYSHVVGHAASPTRTVYVDMTLTPSKVKVMEHLNFRQLPINTHLYVYLFRHFHVKLKIDGC